MIFTLCRDGISHNEAVHAEQDEPARAWTCCCTRCWRAPTA